MFLVKKKNTIKTVNDTGFHQPGTKITKDILTPSGNNNSTIIHNWL